MIFGKWIFTSGGGSAYLSKSYETPWWSCCLSLLGFCESGTRVVDSVDAPSVFSYRDDYITFTMNLLLLLLVVHHVLGSRTELLVPLDDLVDRV
jgi:hypothetical protein